jgi:acetyl esterase/lipase
MRTSLLVAAVLVSSFTSAQNPIKLYPGTAPGSEHWTQKEISVDTPYGTVLQNVSIPTITPYLPDKGKANGTAVIVAPGGACIGLAIEHEGTSVARWLQDKGFAAFVLKYRIPGKKGEGIPAGMNFDEACKYGIADGIQAVKLVRQHAGEWGISPDRVGFLGFSAGAMVTSGVLLQPDAASRPNFAAPIYGGPFGAMPKIPANLPPIFMAWAQDDQLVLEPVNKFYEALKAAGNKPEVHIYPAGGHGFGMKHQGTTSDHWIDEFYFWLDWQGLTKPVTR